MSEKYKQLKVKDLQGKFKQHLRMLIIWDHRFIREKWSFSNW
jgi:hypothetical protein